MFILTDNEKDLFYTLVKDAYIWKIEDDISGFCDKKEEDDISG